MLPPMRPRPTKPICTGAAPCWGIALDASEQAARTRSPRVRRLPGMTGLLTRDSRGPARAGAQRRGRLLSSPSRAEDLPRALGHLLAREAEVLVQRLGGR